ncbi:serine/threonine protein kinase [Ktedonosporobacter rubrisoli]|uniref:non-specific serine/threonine protein kinase n=1 Tax=Ktedonosporobacter rubrisoli TaxID=2509675 RepID=A0A4P6JU37_KTERU|nr:serine/threonine-protein kinase [Ktedonosporobacter rubrisoli]QBD78855.1 serine/threonine protein kinase [Ktedonosporobacter rubrisoli]
MNLAGQQVDRYRLIRRVGSGGMGDVYLSIDEHIEQSVAIKLIRTDASKGGDMALFLHEATAIARLDHPHILPLYDYGEVNIEGTALAYLVMPFRQEGTLSDWHKQLPSTEHVSLDIIVHFIQQAAAALQHAHDRQVIHQDVKPSNFLIRARRDIPDRPDLLLTDFGIARFHTTDADASQPARGTPSYMAPEQWRRQPVPATDQYALAIMAYQLITDRLPFLGRSEHLMRQHLTAQPEAPGKYNSHVPSALDAVILQALAKRPDERFPSVAAFAQAFQQATQPGSPRPALIPMSKQEAYSPAHMELVQSHPAQSVSPPSTSVHQDPQAADRLQPDTSAIQEQILPSRSGAGRGFLRGRSLLLIGLALLLIVVSSGILYALNSYKAYSLQLAASATVRAATAISTAATAHSIATASAANPNPYPPHTGRLVLNDPLKDASRGYGWDNYNGNDEYCQFQDGAYRVQEARIQSLYNCVARNTDLSNFVFEIDMTFLAGDAGGIILRDDEVHSQDYHLILEADGSYDFVLSPGPDIKTVLARDKLPAFLFHKGQQANRLAVVARQQKFDLYVNDQFITSVTDKSYSHGQIGVMADTTAHTTTLLFRNARVWQI